MYIYRQIPRNGKYILINIGRMSKHSCYHSRSTCCNTCLSWLWINLTSPSKRVGLRSPLAACSVYGDLTCSIHTVNNAQMLRYNAKNYRHSFCRAEKWIFIITNLYILYIILLSTQFWTCVYKIRQYWANYTLRCVARNVRANVKMSCPLLRKTP